MSWTKKAASKLPLDKAAILLSLAATGTVPGELESDDMSQWTSENDEAASAAIEELISLAEKLVERIDSGQRTR